VQEMRTSTIDPVSLKVPVRGSNSCASPSVEHSCSRTTQ